MSLSARRFRLALVCIALLCASGVAAATDGRHLSADGAGSCPDGETATAADADRVEDPEADPAAANAARRTPKAKPAAEVLAICNFQRLACKKKPRK